LVRIDRRKGLMAALNLPLRDIFSGNPFCDRPTKKTPDGLMLTKGVSQNDFRDRSCRKLIQGSHNVPKIDELGK
jgi:hypothetical protein